MSGGTLRASTTRLALSAVLLLAGCTELRDVAPGTVVTCTSSGRLLLFGGAENLTFYQDTLLHRAEGWVSRTSALPTGRSRHAMAFDSRRGMAIVHGGYDRSRDTAGDTWGFDGTNWSSSRRRARRS